MYLCKKDEENENDENEENGKEKDDIKSNKGSGDEDEAEDEENDEEMDEVSGQHDEHDFIPVNERLTIFRKRTTILKDTSITVSNTAKRMAVTMKGLSIRASVGQTYTPKLFYI